MKRYTKMEYENPDEMTFGFSKHPVKTKNGLEIGAGYVNPIIKEQLILDCLHLS